MIIQLHWQNLQKPEETEFVAQGDTDEIEFRLGIQPVDWIRLQIHSHRDSCPDKWIPKICWGDHPAMMLTQSQQEN